MEKDELLKNVPNYETIIGDFADGKGTFYSKIPISEHISKDAETGFLYCKDSILGNVGVQKYLGKEIGLKDEDADKVIEMVRDEESVFDEVSMSSFEGKPITLFHPKGKVNSKNYKKFLVGSIKDVKRDNENLAGNIVIYDEYTIDKVVKGELKDLSLGYKAKVVQMADGRYKQTDIVINHLAIVEEGRAINAQIVDNKTVKESNEETTLEPKNCKNIFKDTVYITKTNTTNQRINTYDDDTGEEITKEVSTFESKRSKYDVLKQQLIDSKTNKKGENKKMEKDFKYFMAELKDLAVYPKGEFRDKAYEALAEDCKETLGTVLPTIADTKQSAIANSVGLKDSKLDLDKEEKGKSKTLVAYVKDESRFYDNLYRKMDNVETARKYANMTYQDVHNAIAEGRTL